MKVVTISGSIRNDSSNVRLLEKLSDFSAQIDFEYYNQLGELPVFQPDLDRNPLPESVKKWRQTVQDCDALMISTPEYIHNLPAVLKNAFEWITSSGELVGKKTVAITFTPQAPRGEKAMKSLLWCLQALDSNVITSLELYKTEIDLDKPFSDDVVDIFTNLFDLLLEN